VNTAATNFDPWQWFQSLHSDVQIQLFGGAVATVVVIIAIICYLINSIHRRRAELELKRELIERGMSADEIATVIRATPTTGRSRGHKTQPSGHET